MYFGFTEAKICEANANMIEFRMFESHFPMLLDFI